VNAIAIDAQQICEVAYGPVWGRGHSGCCHTLLRQVSNPLAWFKHPPASWPHRAISWTSGGFVQVRGGVV